MTNPASTVRAPDPIRRRTLRRRLPSLLTALLLVSLAGCLGGSAPPERLFRLTDPVPPAAAGEKRPAASGLPVPGILVVEGFEARGALARQRTIFYRDLTQPNETQYYPASQWEEPPAVMVQAAMASCLDRAGLFEGVVRRDRRLRPRYTLVGVLDQLEERVAGACSEAMIRVEMTLIDEETNHVLLKGAYQAAQPAGGGQIDEVLPAFDRALSGICAAVVDDLRRIKPGGRAVIAAPPQAGPAPACAR